MHLHPDAGTPPPGYYLVGNSGTTPGYAMVLDGQGVPVWYDESSKAGVDDVDDVVPGAVSFFTTWTGAPLSVSTSTLADEPGRAFGDGARYPRAPRVAERRLPRPLRSGPRPKRRPLEGGPPLDRPRGGTVPTTSRIFDCDRRVRAEHRGHRLDLVGLQGIHFNPSLDSTLPAIVTQLPTVALDPFHCNSIDVDPGTETSSSRSRNMRLDILHRPIDRHGPLEDGGSASTKDGAIYVRSTDPFTAARRAAATGLVVDVGAGQISVFDDESSRRRRRGAPLESTWQARSGTGRPPGRRSRGSTRPANSSDRGSFRISADGSRVIGWGTSRAASTSPRST